MPIQEIVAIIDRSGSMHGKEEDTIGGINTTIEELKTSENSDEINFSLKFFNEKEEMKIRSKNITEIRPLQSSELRPYGSTALLDAIGNTINYFTQKKLQDEDSFEQCLIYVATDGYENASKYFNKNSLKQIIQNAETSYNIKVMYLGANQDAIFEASQIGIPIERAINFNENRESSQNVYRAVATSAQRSMTGYNAEFSQSERLESTL
tara:strand:+ start:1000 stop:1626 length:627 start_codon:yes stop_codon:yes gene_type:complete